MERFLHEQPETWAQLATRPHLPPGSGHLESSEMVGRSHSSHTAQLRMLSTCSLGNFLLAMCTEGILGTQKAK